MATALYRRYRPESFAEVIGQSHVTDPLMTALRTNRVNHAYLFSGPRGCGKTTSARILARCLNCVEGPTDTPCGVCPSCVELSRDGGGSLDVVEMDAASNGGVDDARDLRERAIFAPSRDRYKIFIIDEAHMVSPQGFNALLKLVEEPPEHVKFIFATTEPEKVIGTIRSRTHHYPFRLIPPAQMLDYASSLCVIEGITVEPGVLALVIRAGGGSARDTLSLLDQLIAGSEGNTVSYERAVSLLGYTHATLLDEAVDALAAGDAASAFAAVDRVIETGQDPRRFVEDLLERLRDLILVAATGANADAVLRGIPADELERMHGQAKRFGSRELSRAADITNSSLTEMTGATSPRLHLELMIARLLVRSGAAGLGQEASASASAPAAAPAPVSAPVLAPAQTRPPVVTSAPVASAPTPNVAVPLVAPATTTPVPPGPVGTRELLEAWPQVLEAISAKSRTAWIVVVAAQVRSLEGDVLTLVFGNESDAASFRPQKGVPGGVHEILRQAIVATLGVRVQFKISTAGQLTQPIDRLTETGSIPVPGFDQSTSVKPTREFATPVVTTPDDDEAPPEEDDGWNVVSIPQAPALGDSDAVGSAPTVLNSYVPPAPATPVPENNRYGESVVREILNASFISEETAEPARPSSSGMGA
ncbi:MAG: DNA polymerase III subunit gamma and tau [Actinomycetales bacterium]|nr:DNA polymerase III subunit gamma and tau [Actinomycetales bacterium]